MMMTKPPELRCDALRLPLLDSVRKLSKQNHAGAKEAMGQSGSQQSVQKRTDAPSPSSTWTEELNMALTAFSGLDGSFVHGGASAALLPLPS